MLRRWNCSGRRAAERASPSDGERTSGVARRILPWKRGLHDGALRSTLALKRSFPRQSLRCARYPGCTHPKAVTENVLAVAAAKIRNNAPSGSAEEPAAEWVAIELLVPWVKNPRRNDDAVKRVADSLRRFGFGAPIVARRENHEIIAGHTRVKAARLLGMKRVPVRYLNLDERQAHLLALADNKLGEVAEWDDAALGELLSELSFGDALLAGWSGKDLGKLASEMLGDVGESSGGNGKRRLRDTLTYSVMVECDGEEAQTKLLEKLELDGLICKALVT